MAKKGDDSHVEDDFADGQSDSKVSDKKDDNSSIMVNDFQSKSFDIGQTIDLESKDLADVLAEKDLLPRKAIMKKTQPCVAASEKVLSEEYWEM